MESSQVGDDQLESIFQYIFDNNVVDLESRFDITQTITPTETSQERKVWTLKFFDLNQNLHSSIILAIKEGDVFLDALNLSQITKIIGSSSKMILKKLEKYWIQIFLNYSQINRIVNKGLMIFSPSLTNWMT